MKRRDKSNPDHAQFWLRASAYILDAFFLSAIIGVIIFVIILGVGFGALFGGGDAGSLSRVTSVALVVAAVVGFMLMAAYYVFFWSCWGGQTPGKFVCGLKVVRPDGSLLTWRRALLRFAGYLVCLVPFLGGYLWATCDRRRQGLHDKMADTYVVRVRKSE